MTVKIINLYMYIKCKKQVSRVANFILTYLQILTYLALNIILMVTYFIDVV